MKTIVPEEWANAEIWGALSEAYRAYEHQPSAAQRVKDMVDEQGRLVVKVPDRWTVKESPR